MLLFFALLLLCLQQQGLVHAYNVLQYGAIGNGKHDDTNAFVQAWKDLCNDVGPKPMLTIPLGKRFRVSPIHFEGPCKFPSVHIELLGAIVAPMNPSLWTGCVFDAWLSFSNVNGLIIDGGGMINGRGNLWWKQFSTYDRQVKNTNGCRPRPTALHFLNCNGLRLSRTRHRNSPRNHIGLTGCNNSTLSNLNIVAPVDSPNTDGINIALSMQVRVQHSTIQTGDDCIALSNGVSKIFITGIACGPGHGISVGSLGAKGDYNQVEGVYVKNCTFTATQNGARIKTWQGGSGYARDITFEEITLDNVYNPIIIDQFYCNGGHNCKIMPSAVKVSDIRYISFQGTSSSKVAINFNCSDSVPCTSIVMDQVNIASALAGETTTAFCNNAHGTVSFTKPTATCLSQ